MRNYDNDLLKVRYIGDYYSVRLTKNKIYFAEKDSNFGLLKITDDLGDEYNFEPDEFEIVKVLERGGMPDDGEGTDL